jgi:hypothetical protein
LSKIGGIKKFFEIQKKKNWGKMSKKQGWMNIEDEQGEEIVVKKRQEGPVL